MTAPTSQSFASAGAVNVIGALLEQRTGQQIAANRVWRIEAALKPVMRDHELETLDQLVMRLSHERTGALADAVVHALLNQETSFFRDAGVIEIILGAAQALQAQAPDRRLRIWSAGCSAGQEPYSLAMAFAELVESSELLMPEIVGSDVCPAIIARARTARYSQFEIQRGLPVRRMLEWFENVDNAWVARVDLAKRVQFRQHDLTRDRPPPGKFDIVLCRNVLLYFSAAVRRSVFDTLRGAMHDGGLLVLGAGETVIGQTDLFRPSERFRGCYQAEPKASALARAATR